MHRCGYFLRRLAELPSGVGVCLFAFRLIVDSHVLVQKARERRCGTVRYYTIHCVCVCLCVLHHSWVKAAKSLLGSSVVCITTGPRMHHRVGLMLHTGDFHVCVFSYIHFPLFSLIHTERLMMHSVYLAQLVVKESDWPVLNVYF